MSTERDGHLGAVEPPGAGHSLLKELMGTDCRCGASKNSANTFCSKCYYRLPVEMRKGLFQRMGGGYEEAYAVAVEFLERT